MSWLALTRDVSASLPRCELTHREREPIDLDRARSQHGAYREALAAMGCEVVSLPALDDHPDAVFVEDVAVVTDELAVLTRPGAASRRGEVEAMAPELLARRELARVEAPATLDGGDVCRAGRHVLVGRGSRTDDDGVAALERALAPHGYQVHAVPVAGALHLKTVVSALDATTLLVDGRHVDEGALQALGHRLVSVPEHEPDGANVLVIGGQVLVPADCPDTASLLSGHGLTVHTVANDELRKAEAGLTCCSLILREGGAA
jgi:dimethylargininase